MDAQFFTRAEDVVLFALRRGAVEESDLRTTVSNFAIEDEIELEGVPGTTRSERIFELIRQMRADGRIKLYTVSVPSRTFPQRLYTTTGTTITEVTGDAA